MSPHAGVPTPVSQAGTAWGRSGPGRWAAEHPLASDAALVVLLDLMVLRPEPHSAGIGPWWHLLLSQLLVLPLVLRRRYPWLVFWLLAAVAAVQWAAEVRFAADAALLIALYTVAAHQSRRRALVAAGVLELGVVLAAVRFAPTGDGVIASIVFLSGLVAAALFAGITGQTRRQYLAALVDRAARLEHERDQQALLAATAERTRMARELHDVIAHSLTVNITLADAAALANPAAPQEATDAMLAVAATGRESLAEMRRLLGVLRTDHEAPAELAPQPGLDRIDSLIADVRAAGLPARLTVTGTPQPMTPTTQSAAYRIIQESLTNALKHADQATRVQVDVGWQPDQVRIGVTDDGRPTTMAGPVMSPAGRGLIGMRERAAIFGGTIDAGPRPGRGWSVQATLPLEPTQ